MIINKKILFIFLIKVLLGLVYCLYVDAYWDLNKWFIVGVDEERYYYSSEYLWGDIKKYGFPFVLKNYYIYSGSEQFLYYFLLAPFFNFSTPLVFIVIVKAFVFSLSANFFFRIANYLYGSKVALIAWLSIAFYFPLHFFSVTYMRDDLIFFFCIAGIYFSIVSNFEDGFKYWLSLFLIIFLLSFLRIHAAIALVLFFCVYNYKFIFAKINLKIIIGISILVFSLFIWRGDIIVRIMERVSVYQIIVNLPLELLRLVLSPNPLNISTEYPLILHYWYALSLPISLAAVLLFLLSIKKHGVLKEHWSSIMFLIAYLAPYVATDTFGFRQQAVIVPILFLFLALSFFHIKGVDK